MKYIINLTIVFDPDNRQLLLRNNSQLVTGLSNPATRLLSELIKNNKTELSRDTLIKHVWEDYGYSPSSASLSNHISELRKSFEILGESKEIIMTVPRIGFKLDATIHPETKQPLMGNDPEVNTDSNPEQTYIAEQSSEQTTDNTPLRNLGRNLKKITVKKIVISVCFLTTIMILAIINQPDKHKTSFLGTQGKCKIYATDKKKNIENYKNAKKIITKTGTDCINETQDVYYAYIHPFSEVLKTHLLTACPKNKNGSYKTCNNYRFSE